MGGHLGRWICSYASIPPTRTVPESFVYSFQYYNATTSTLSDSGTTYALATLSKKVDSRLVHEYFLASDAANYPSLSKPQILLDGTHFYKVGDGVLQFSTARTVFVTTDGANFLADDSDTKIWHGVILCRVARFIVGPTDAFWGTAVSPPTLE